MSCETKLARATIRLAVAIELYAHNAMISVDQALANVRAEAAPGIEEHERQVRVGRKAKKERPI